ncbi:MAG TPA: glycosyltransferase [Thermomicrobiales bacterium]|nr:glycosyltransferase [Thermomicrobiales bacterium]
MNVLVVTNMYPTAESPAFGSFVYDQVQALRRAGAEVDVLFVNGRESTWNYLRAYPRLWRRLRRRRYDVVHAHYVLAGLVARAQWGHKTVLTHHGIEALGAAMGYARWQSWLCRLLTPLFDEVVHVSEEVRRALRDADGWVIPCGVDLEVFTPTPRAEARARLGLPPERRLVLWAGEPWRPEKRFYLVEQAVERVKAALPDTDLVLLTDRPHDVVPLYMSACDALVLASRAEGSPMVVKEAMACNLPVVSVPVGDVAEVIGATPGCALARDDPDALAAALLATLREPRRTDGRARIAHLAQDRTARRLLEVYAHAGRPRRGRRQHAVGG